METFDAPGRRTAPQHDVLADARIRARTYGRPRDVVADPDLTTDEKRAILAAWASDQNAVDPLPTLRRLCGTNITADIDDVLDALCALDRDIRGSRSASVWRRHQDRWLSGVRQRSHPRRAAPGRVLAGTSTAKIDGGNTCSRL